IEEPVLPGNEWVKVRTRLCGICASDLHLVTLQINPMVSLAAMKRHMNKKAPKFMGHEMVGEVVEAGSRAQGFQPGDRVVYRSGPCCESMGRNPPCAPCGEGNYSICQNKSEADLPPNMGGGFGEYFVAHHKQLFKVPEGINDEQGALIEPTACSVRTVLRCPPKGNERALVIGGGVIGLNAIRAARIIAPQSTIVALVKYPFQGEAALMRGADRVLYTGAGDLYDEIARITGGRLYTGKFGNKVIMGGFDVIYNCVGSAGTLHDSLRWVRSRGTVVLVGSELKLGRFDYTPLWHQEVHLIGSEAHGMENHEGWRISTFDLVAQWIVEKKLDLSGLITHTYPLSGYREAMQVLLNKKTSKAIKGAFTFK
ncbi:MAG: zinc-binding dehydrogenase, partial [Planctomycetes bacterium]|nr:zinc-binding dehydrogenase [Planctomycetota bacterium]